LGTVDGEPFEQATELARLTGFEARYGAAHHSTLADPEDGRVVGAYLWGNAVLSRWPVRASRLHLLPNAADDDLVEPAEAAHELRGVRYADAPSSVRESRSLLACAIDVDGTSVHVLATHLTHIGAGQRRRQAQRVVEIAEALAGPVVLAGDLNATLESADLAPLRPHLDDAFSAVGVPLGDPRRRSCGTDRIDHVLVRGLVPVACRVVTEAGNASDHWPIVATLSL
ncbi:MAG: endonuclease/exonuclease/phosphatase family protein, partial [Chloroflexi bacterium]|nr:endonuclease/exonuclease/phosphatase family protein [Chloroflexota bacterium]